MTDFLLSPMRVTRHAGDDDLLSAGLGLTGLRAPVPPGFADPENPKPQEVRRRAIWSSWRGIADLAPGGGFAEIYGSLLAIPGREFQAFAKLPGAAQPHRLLIQIPDGFNRRTRCVVVAASSGSRGIYGAIALAGGWGLPQGCAVAYTDKGCGTGYFDLDTHSGVQLDGTRAEADAGLEFLPDRANAASHAVAIKHAHSGDNPEADWGRHVLQAAAFALHALDEALPSEAPFTWANTRVIALGLSNGGAAALRAAELDLDGRLAGVVAVSPNVFSANARPLYDYASEAAILLPCALLHPRFDGVALARPLGTPPAAWIARGAALHERGLLQAHAPTAQAREAYQKMHSSGWSDAAIAAGALSTSFDLWRALTVTYASAYSRSGADAMPGGYRFAVLDAGGAPRASTTNERAVWAADGSGIPPSSGIGLVDTLAHGSDPTLPGLLALRELWNGGDASAQRLHAGVAATRARAPRAGLSVIVIHGADDGLIPEAFSSAAYVRMAAEQGADSDLRYWRVANTQHFDAFLGLAPLGACYLPLLPYAYAAMEAMLAHLTQGTPLPASADIATIPRGWNGAMPASLHASHLGAIPR